MTDSRSQPMTELDEWKQAASVEAGLRREFYDRALTAEAALQEAYADHRKQKVRIEELEAVIQGLMRVQPSERNGMVLKEYQAARDAMRCVARAEK